MVHVKRVELSNFKSFGGTTPIPLLPGFTVVSGPNGSGKSNILDALLFCLGLASSKGMRAERLPDLVNHNKERRGTVEASVTVTFDISDIADSFWVEGMGNGEWGMGSEDEGRGNREEEAAHNQEAITNHQPEKNNSEWSVTRRLRVTKQGSYTSTYYINGETCTQTELHEQLNRLRIYPEGYNVVLQGDVTSIISMNSKERRQIIDELAGVAAFDRKIDQTKNTLDRVKEQEDRYHIIEKELIAQCDRLAADKIKAEKYQKLRIEFQAKQAEEAILKWQLLQYQIAQLTGQIAGSDREIAQLTSELTILEAQIKNDTAELEQLNSRVKALGEEEQVAVASTLATQQAEQRQLQQRQTELSQNLTQTQANIKKTQTEITQYQQTQQEISAQINNLETQDIASLQSQRDTIQNSLNQSREQANIIASASEAWVQQQTSLTRQIETILKTLNPQRTEQAQLQERYNQLNRQIAEQTQLLQNLEPEITSKQAQSANLNNQLTNSTTQLQSIAKYLATAEQELQIQQQTQTRLLGEQREKQRQLDKLEAQTQAQQEVQGTYATKIILQSNIPGVCGLVAQLGRVEPRYQLALETAAGARLGNIVVEDDSIAAAGIELLKQKRAGRATFLPLNKIKQAQFNPHVALTYAKGFIDYAVRLINCEPRYQIIFAYVFGNTVVFATLNDARPYLGQHRIVTLEGEILEVSGAMTGGTSTNRLELRFGTNDEKESQEMRQLRSRLQEIEQILERCAELVNQGTVLVKQLTEDLNQEKTTRSQTQLRLEQIDKEIQSLLGQKEQLQAQLAKNSQEIAIAQQRLEILDRDLPLQEAQLQDLRLNLAELEQSQTQSEWQKIQVIIKTKEIELNNLIQSLTAGEKQLLDLTNQQERLTEKITEGYQKTAEAQNQANSLQQQIVSVNNQLTTISENIIKTQESLNQLEQKLGETKQKRDIAEQNLREKHLQQQQLSWKLEKLQETQLARKEELLTLQNQLEIQKAEIGNGAADAQASNEVANTEAETNNPSTTPSVSPSVAPSPAKLEELQKELRSLQKKLQAMEPVNMLALEEYDRTQTRLQELSEKLATLEGERTELLLRVENFTTLRFRAFKEAFDAINENFESIFAELSEGDGYLQLDDPEDPFNGGLNLVAHPKGKPVQRLASMSGGEKSLTALSFIFALQRYRPSPFYAFDEVDMFLDGANVERLSRMIKQEAKLAQFIVVSLRRPMIEASERTIGVTQARGAYTQVLGLKL
ncbi:MAG TPA: chromosome segregation protein SMC [Cyanobacteria bacterium UBA11149]|nr:chromosome segregation protein SMC [Cyanobacteria bacterium UBA11366]HBR73701.1 chromosome segregation protein SMC [Cyanobacteria bacterium UBA11159]HBS68632.1 chromosome segregation protein SMC [Cyanobacteria bacterium UBA11153]HBW87307.1 chromosome segregation protein SMC [Cyanobacteria bacterium UBA11149]HCA97775.1 chromosome segregation protein SMC [Cyanobacteria bacterium UBA9226]